MRSVGTISPYDFSQLWFRFIRGAATFRIFNYALDEIQVFEGPCGEMFSDRFSCTDI